MEYSSSFRAHIAVDLAVGIVKSPRPDWATMFAITIAVATDDDLTRELGRLPQLDESHKETAICRGAAIRDRYFGPVRAVERISDEVVRAAGHIPVGGREAEMPHEVISGLSADGIAAWRRNALEVLEDIAKEVTVGRCQYTARCYRRETTMVESTSHGGRIRVCSECRAVVAEVEAELAGLRAA